MKNRHSLQRADGHGFAPTHGEAAMIRRTVEYTTWINIRERCNNPKSTSYPRYGALGVRVCRRWENSYEDFLSDMGRRPSAFHSIERSNSRLGYSPENCRWATRIEQGRNKKNNRNLTVGGITRCLSEWAEISGLSGILIHKRIQLGWPVEKAVTQPAAKMGGRPRKSINNHSK